MQPILRIDYQLNNGEMDSIFALRVTVEEDTNPISVKIWNMENQPYATMEVWRIIRIVADSVEIHRA